MDWSSSPRHDRFEYVRVDSATFEENGHVDVIRDGGEVVYNDLTAIKASGSVPLLGALDIGTDCLRIYSVSTALGESARVCHGTFYVSVPSMTYRPHRRPNIHDGTSQPLREGKADLYSLLLLLDEDATDAPLSFAAGTAIIPAVAGIVRQKGLNVTADGSDAALSSAAVFDSGTPWLEVVNTLLGYAGFDTAEVDAYGTVLLQKYTNPAHLSPVHTFLEDDRCILTPGIVHELDLRTVPNKVVAVVSDKDGCMTAVAVNDDPSNRFSTAARGRTVTHVEDVSQAASQAELDALAKRVLALKTSAVESFDIEHTFYPYTPGQAIGVDAMQTGFAYSGVVTSKKVSLSPGMLCKTHCRRFIRS